MKVIVAGFSKTGTKSLNTALKKIGYSVYDYLENVFLLQEDYRKIFHDGWTTEDFKRMYKNVDAVTDGPAHYFWEEIHKAFPDAKIIFMMRENEDVWFESIKRQIVMEDTNIMLRLSECFSPTMIRASQDVRDPLLSVIFGIEHTSKWRIRRRINESVLKLKYRAHNANVMYNAPADKLLIFNLKEGWEPLCKFLGVPVPDEPFPHRNVGGNIVKELLQEDPILKKIVRETFISMSVVLAAFAVTGYYTYKVGPSGVYNSVRDGLSKSLTKIGFNSIQ